MYHEITLIGHLGRNPEMRYTSSGQAVTSFSLAVNRRYTGGNGQPVEETLWARVSAWGKLAETTNEFLRKGRLVLVKGRLQADPANGGPRTYTRQDGTIGASFEVTASSVLFLSGRTEEEEEEAPEEVVPF